MHRSTRKLASLSLFAVAALGACNGDAKANNTGDVLAQDSSLDLAVMSATGDSLKPSGADTNLTPVVSPAPAAVSAPAPAAVAPQEVVMAQPVVAPSQSRVSNSSARARARRAPARVASSSRVVTSQRATAVRTTTQHRQSRVVRSTSRSTTSTSVAVNADENSSTVVAAPATTTRSTSVVIPTGASFSLVTQQKICASSAKVGDTFNASLAKDVVTRNGVAIPAGTSASGEVISLSHDDTPIRVAVRSIDFDGHSYPVTSDVTFTDMKVVKIQPKGGSASRVLAGAGIGAILGRVIGGNAKSTIIGAAGGAAAGSVVSSQSVRYDQCVPSGGQIIAHLAQPLKVQLGD